VACSATAASPVTDAGAVPAGNEALLARFIADQHSIGIT
jgi:hypothetical protein